jgi:hypothetical protein
LDEDAAPEAPAKFVYAFDNLEKIIIAPVHKLLHPGDDPLINEIPVEVRRRLLELDPFIVNLDRFFPSWHAEGIACYVHQSQAPNHIPVFRAWNGSDHFYTTSHDEFDGLPAQYIREGIAFYVADDQTVPNHIPLFRLYSPGSDDHFYTTSESERDDAQNSGYYSERLLGYVVSETQSPIPEGHVPLYRAWNPSIGDHFYTTNLEEYENATTAPKDLTEAVDSTIDPSRGNRAEKIGEWYLNTGTDLHYTIGESIELRQGETTQLNWGANVEESLHFDGSVAASFTYGLSTLVGGGRGTGTRVLVGYQSSLETVLKESKTASCHLVRNQNAADSGGIGIYYDKVFSTLMFRKIPDGPITLIGSVRDLFGFFQDRISVELILETLPDIEPPIPIDPKTLPKTFETITTINGQFEFKGLYPGEYVLKTGDKVDKFSLALDDGEREKIIEKNMMDVRRTIDLQTSPVWEVRRGLRLDSYELNSLRTHLEDIFDHADLARAIGTNDEHLEEKMESIVLKLPSTPLFRLRQIEPEQMVRLQALNINSIQELWSAVKKDDRLTEISDITGIGHYSGSS